MDFWAQKIFLIALLLFSFEASTKIAPNKMFRLKVDFQYQSEKKTIKQKNEILLIKNNRMWNPLSPLKEGMMLLARPISYSAKGVEMEYMVIDTNKNPHAIITIPKVFASLGETTPLVINEDPSGKGEKISINVTADTIDSEKKAK